MDHRESRRHSPARGSALRAGTTAFAFASSLTLGCSADGPAADTTHDSSSGDGSSGSESSASEMTTSGVSASTSTTDGTSTPTGSGDDTSTSTGSGDDTTGGDPPPLDGWCASGDSVLASVVATMEPGSWAELPENESLASLPMVSSLLYWNDSGVWDPVARQVGWIGGPGTCCADPATYQRLTYDVESDIWSIAPTPYEGQGHAYDGNAFDPAAGVHYFARYLSRAVKRWDGMTWDALPDTPWPTTPAVGLTWFPDLMGGDGGLVFVNGSGRLAWFDGTGWIEIPGGEDEPWGTYNLFGEYNPVHKVMWLGAGNGAERVNYILNADLELERRPDAPVSLSNGLAIHSVDPVGGEFLVKHEPKDGPISWWSFDPQDDTWTELVEMQDEPNFSGTSEFQVPIPECGVVLVFARSGDTRKAYLYRHL